MDPARNFWGGAGSVFGRKAPEKFLGPPEVVRNAAVGSVFGREAPEKILGPPEMVRSAAVGSVFAPPKSSE